LYVCSFAAGLLAYGAQFLFGVTGNSGRAGTVVLMHLVAGLPEIVVSPLAGLIAAAAVRPKGDVKWIVALAVLNLARYAGSNLLGHPIDGWSNEDFIGIILVAALLVAGVCFGGWIIRRRVHGGER
jgi:hypothetical protein